MNGEWVVPSFEGSGVFLGFRCEVSFMYLKPNYLNEKIREDYYYCLTLISPSKEKFSIPFRPRNSRPISM